MRNLSINVKIASILTVVFLSHTVYAEKGCDGYDPDSAVLPTGKGCKQPKTTIKYDPDCARLKGCSKEVKPKKIKKMTAIKRHNPPANKTFQANRGARTQTADTTCSGVSECNDMIATCIALGGSSTATSYEPSTGAPNGATCFSPAAK